MKYTKKQIEEIVNSDGELIDDDDYPTNGADLESAANNTTDYNVQVGHQPYRYDMLGRFGFTLLPFFESEDKENKDNDISNELKNTTFEIYKDIVGYYYKNPKKLQSDYRRLLKSEESNEIINKFSEDWVNNIIDVIKPHLEKSFNDLNEALKENISESEFVEGKMLDNKKPNEFAKKKNDNDIVDKQINKIAGLINKLSDEDFDNLIKKINERRI